MDQSNDHFWHALIEWLSAQCDTPEKNHLKIKTAKRYRSSPAFNRDLDISDSSLSPTYDITTMYYSDDGFIGYAGDCYDTEHLIPDHSFTSDQLARLIPIDTDKDRENIDLHLSMIDDFLLGKVSSTEKLLELRRYHRDCCDMTRRACRKIWGGTKLYSFQTLRKQFSASMKAIYGSEITADLMKYGKLGSPLAAHYDKASQAFGSFKNKGADSKNGAQR